MIPAKDFAHQAEAVALLTDAFRNQVNIPAFLKSLTAPVQTVEDAVWNVIHARILDNAVNAQLDTWGRLVGEPRLGRGDDDYRAAIRLRIMVNRSQGRAEEVLQVAATAAAPQPAAYHDGGVASFSIVVLQLKSALSVLKLLGAARAAGTHGVLAFSPAGAWSDSLDFVYGSNVGSVVNAHTYGDYVSDTLHAVYLSGQAMAK